MDTYCWSYSGELHSHFFQHRSCIRIRFCYTIYKRRTLFRWWLRFCPKRLFQSEKDCRNSQLRRSRLFKLYSLYPSRRICGIYNTVIFAPISNNLPSVPQLVYPLANQNLQTNSVQLAWESADDIDGDTLNYQLFYALSGTFEIGIDILVNNAKCEERGDRKRCTAVYYALTDSIRMNTHMCLYVLIHLLNM